MCVCVYEYCIAGHTDWVINVTQVLSSATMCSRTCMKQVVFSKFQFDSCFMTGFIEERVVVILIALNFVFFHRFNQRWRHGFQVCREDDSIGLNGHRRSL